MIIGGKFKKMEKNMRKLPKNKRETKKKGLQSRITSM
jgi:hypothetical protein